MLWVLHQFLVGIRLVGQQDQDMSYLLTRSVDAVSLVTDGHDLCPALKEYMEICHQGQIVGCIARIAWDNDDANIGLPCLAVRIIIYVNQQRAGRWLLAPWLKYSVSRGNNNKEHEDIK